MPGNKDDGLTVGADLRVRFVVAEIGDLLDTFPEAFEFDGHMGEFGLLFFFVVIA